MKDDVARDVGRVVVGTYWEIEKFNYQISALLLMVEMVAAGFPRALRRVEALLPSNFLCNELPGCAA